MGTAKNLHNQSLLSKNHQSTNSSKEKVSMKIMISQYPESDRKAGLNLVSNYLKSKSPNANPPYVDFG